MTSPIEMLAIARSFSKDELDLARDGIAPGKYQVDARIHVVGEIQINADTQKTPTSSTPWLTAMAVLVRRCGFQRDAAIKLIMDSVNEAVTLDKDAAEALMLNTGVKQAKDALAQEYAKLPKTPVRGAVSADVKIVTI